MKNILLLTILLISSTSAYADFASRNKVMLECERNGKISANFFAAKSEDPKLISELTTQMLSAISGSEAAIALVDQAITYGLKYATDKPDAYRTSWSRCMDTNSFMLN